ncbi:hypothetical protein Hanom_Chr16g01458351 [Helianthus anomalus]
MTLSTNRHYQDMQSMPGFIEPLEHHLFYLLEDPILLLMASRVGDKAVAPSTASVTGLQQTSVPPCDSALRLCALFGLPIFPATRLS